MCTMDKDPMSDIADNMVEAAKELSDAQIQFICEECEITKDDLFHMDEDTLYDAVYDTMCEIEIAEIPSSDDEPESERCIMASDIVTLLGNALAKSEGFYDEQDENKEDNVLP